MTTVIEPYEEGASFEKWRQRGKELILEELVTLLENGNRVGNRSKLVTDFINRERQASTAIGNGIAIPHIRSMQAKKFMVAFGRSTDGYDFDSPDGEVSRLFFVMAAPPYEDSLYLRVFKSLMEMLRYKPFREELLNVSSPGELLRAIRRAE
jgi:PTS system fructose-specific IIC component